MKSKIFLAVTLFSLILNAYAGMIEAQKAFDTRDFETALKEAQPLAEQGNAEAQNLMAKLYEFGVMQNFKKAAEWYRKAADQNYAPALETLGNRYSVGLGVPINIRIGLELVRKAADQNYAPAQCDMGRFYSLGFGVKKNFKKSFEWLNKAVGQNNACAMKELGIMYEQGYGVKIDYERAKEWYQRSADLGDENGQFMLQNIERELAK